MARTLASPLLAVDKDGSNASKWPRLGLTQIALLVCSVACMFLAVWTYPEGAALEPPQTRGGSIHSHADAAQAEDGGDKARGVADRHPELLGRHSADDGDKSAAQPKDSRENGDTQTAPRESSSPKAENDLRKQSEDDGHQSATQDGRARESKGMDEKGTEQSKHLAAQEQMKSSTQHQLRKSQTELPVKEDTEEVAEHKKSTAEAAATASRHHGGNTEQKETKQASKTEDHEIAAWEAKVILDGLVCMHPRCDQGLCDQTGCFEPTCNGGGCIQVKTFEASCLGGKCHQIESVRPQCEGGSCVQS